MMDLTEFLKSIWVITIAGGALATLLAMGIAHLFKRKTDKSSPSQNQKQSLVVNNDVKVNIREKPVPNSTLSNFRPGEVSHLKSTGRILFIDDRDLKSKILNLRSAGWSNVSQISRAENLEQQEIRDAEVIFVDYRGVGPAKEQGLAVLSAIRQRYGDSKWLVLYSAHTVPVDAFNRGANSYLAKNSSVYELEQKILEGLRVLRK